MSVKVMAAVWALGSEDDPRPIDPTDKYVLQAIADSANDDGRHSYNSEPTLATKTSLDVRTVRYAIRHLKHHGAISVDLKASERGTNLYAVHLDRYDPCAIGRSKCLGIGRHRPEVRQQIPHPDEATDSGGEATDSSPPGNRFLTSEATDSSNPSVDPSLNLQPTVVPPDGGAAEASNVIALRSDRALAAVNGTLGRLQAEVQAGRKSWSLSDAAKAEWLDLLADDRNLSTAQQFIVGYLALNTGRDVRSFARIHWSMAGQKVARWRALVLYGVDQAITRIDPDEPDERGTPGRPFWSYVETVCSQARARSNGTAPQGDPA